jgi:hypothetical protein
MMNPETQIAIAAADTAKATWWLVGATAFLDAITIGAVVVGWRAASSATESLRLEAEPVLIITQAVAPLGNRLVFPENPISPEAWTLFTKRSYVIDGKPAIASGLELRLRRPSDDPTVQGSGVVAQPGYAGSNRRPAIELEVENVGRSPALAVEIDLEMSVRLTRRPSDDEIPGFQADPQNDSEEADFIVAGTLRSIGTVRLPAIPPQAKRSVRIENKIGLHPANRRTTHLMAQARSPVRVNRGRSSRRTFFHQGRRRNKPRQSALLMDYVSP